MAQAFHTMVRVLTKRGAADGPSGRKIVLATRVQIPERAIPRSLSVTVLSIRGIYDAMLSAGFTPHQAETWTSIALAESGGNTMALNNHDGFTVCKK
jgi:hypothetical protein